VRPTPPARARTLQGLADPQWPSQAGLAEVLAFVEREPLGGQDRGIVDVTVLASALPTPGARLWTLDRSLARLAGRFDVVHRPAAHSHAHRDAPPGRRLAVSRRAYEKGRPKAPHKRRSRIPGRSLRETDAVRVRRARYLILVSL
jgi:hypothetical protein